MILIALFLGAILIVAAIRNSQNALFAAIKTDVPEYLVWAAAIFAVGALGYIKPIKPVSTGLMVLLITAILLGNKGQNAKNILSGFENAWKNPGVAQGNGQGVSAGSETTGGLNLPNVSGGLPDLANIDAFKDFGSTSGGLPSMGGAF